MDEEKMPLIHVCGTVSEQDFSGAVRARGIKKAYAASCSRSNLNWTEPGRGCC